uniref:Uncharacterized protein n=3 Tax=Canis lupus TaxID=9612 RepID=A0A8C0RC69_CANLF
MVSARRLPSSACKAAALWKDTTERQQAVRASSRVTASSVPSLEHGTEGLSFRGRMETHSFSFISSPLSRQGERRDCWPSVQPSMALPQL